MNTQPRLLRVLGVPGAVLLGLGAIVGTGVYVSIGLATGVAGSAVLPALAIAAILATCNGLSSAQLAASHPVSGGTYEYGYRYLSPLLGFFAGWLFLAAKSASAATAALGFAGYFRSLANLGPSWQVPIALLLAACMTAIVLGGMRNSSRINAAIVIFSVGVLLAFVVVMLWPGGKVPASSPGDSMPGGELDSLLQAAALMFVAFTGYGRVATLGEEVRAPRQTIPRAIAWTVGLSFLLYLAVAIALIMNVDARSLGEAAQAGLPLSWAAEQADRMTLSHLVSLGALVAMAGVLLNLVLGLSRVVLAMARRGDMPQGLARLNNEYTSAPASVITVGFVIAVIVLYGDIRSAWSFSAFTVLLYYAITNLAALRLPAKERFIPRAVAIVGLLGCLSLAWFVDVAALLSGLAILVAGLAWRAALGVLKRRET